VRQVTPALGRRVLGPLGKVAATIAVLSSVLHVLALLLAQGQTTPSRVLLGMFALACGACARGLWVAPGRSVWRRTVGMSSGVVAAHVLIAAFQSLGTGWVGDLGAVLHPHSSGASSPADRLLMPLHLLPVAQLWTAACAVAWLSLRQPGRGQLAPSTPGASAVTAASDEKSSMALEYGAP
jgi:hypothetical protein